jgi:hypothetical protein
MAGEVKFIQVGELAQSITEHLLPQVDDLAGRTLLLNYEQDGTITLQFGYDNTLSWALWRVLLSKAAPLRPIGRPARATGSTW